MKRRLAFATLMAGLLSALTIPFMGCGTVGAYAQQNDPTMKASGPEIVTAFNVLGDAGGTCEEKLKGTGSLGKFTYDGLRADHYAGTTDACPNGYLPVDGGEGIFRFSDGSLMSVQITGGSICIDANLIGHLTETYQVTAGGGTGRFQDATGDFTQTATLNAVLFDASGNPLLLTHTGEFNGNVIGVGAQGQQQ